MLANKYRIIGTVGKGSFGSIYRGINIRTQEEVSIKMEPCQSELSLLKHETQVYQYLGSSQGFPTVKWFGIYESNYYMVLTMLGYSLTTLKTNMRCLTLPMTIAIGIQMIERIEYIHNKGLIHRDIKPDNFLLGKKETKNIIHLIDFGFCKRYSDDAGNHIPLQENCPLLGTPNFVSINVQNGLTPSRRDDIESCVYIMIYLITESWSNISREKKILYRSDKRIPQHFQQLLCYCDTLDFNEAPDYQHCKELLV
jgi:serine/threonine protein kinase